MKKLFKQKALLFACVLSISYAFSSCSSDNNDDDDRPTSMAYSAPARYVAGTYDGVVNDEDASLVLNALSDTKLEATIDFMYKETSMSANFTFNVLTVPSRPVEGVPFSIQVYPGTNDDQGTASISFLYTELSGMSVLQVQYLKTPTEGPKLIRFEAK